MPEASSEMLLITKMYDFVLWSCRHIAKFPRSHRFTLGDRMEVRLYELLELFLRAKYSRDRLPTLRKANMELELLRFQFRLAKDLECLSVKSYGCSSRTVNEIGKLLGGWVKKASAKPVQTPRRQP